MTSNVKYFFVLVCAFFATAPSLNAQMILDCENGNHAVDKGYCWDFGAVNYVKSDANVISGEYSAKSFPMTHMNVDNSYAKSPWIKISRGNITLKAKLDNNSGSVKQIIFSYIRYDEKGKKDETEPVTFHTYNYPKVGNFFDTNIQQISVPVPAELYNASEVFKIQLSFAGLDGSNRTYFDDLVIPAEYWSDPSEKCKPLPFGSKVPAENDQDQDGVTDNQDSSPNDSNISFNNYYPAENIFGTLAFEDNWPAKGDYDLNDLVVDYNINRMTNKNNDVVEIRAVFVLKASGASFRNALGVQLDSISPNDIESVTGNKINNNNLFKYASNGLESDQQFANFIVFDDFYAVMKHPGGGIGINTDKSMPFVPYDTIKMVIKFSKPISINAMGGDVFNFYMVSNVTKGERGREIHLPDYIPTSLINSNYYLKNDDNSNTIKKGSKKKNFFRTKRNLPWAINFLSEFKYPLERVSIDKAYNNFLKWAESDGQRNSDWYLDKGNNMNHSLVY
jgi:LruC domain-containing protein